MSECRGRCSADRAPFLDHLLELRARLIVVLWVFLALCLICFFFSGHLFELLVRPYQRVLGAVEHVRLIYTAPQEYFFVQLKLAAFAASAFSFPVLAFHIYRFVAPGLYKYERGVLVPFLLVAPFLFAAGALVAYFFVMPVCLGYFHNLGRNAGIPVELLPRVSEYLDLAMGFILSFGLCFQLPLVMFLLNMFGFISLETLRRGRRYAVVICFIVAAILTPPDILSQVMLGVPLVLVYELGLLAIRLRLRRRSQRAVEMVKFGHAR